MAKKLYGNTLFSMNFLKFNSVIGLVMALGLSTSVMGCGSQDKTIKAATKEDFYGKYSVTTFTCNGVPYEDSSPPVSDLEISIGEASGYLKWINWGSQPNCTVIYRQSYNWNGTTLTGTFTSRDIEGTCNPSPPQGEVISLGTSLLEQVNRKIRLTQSDEVESRFGSECFASSASGLPAKLELQKL